MFEIKMEDNKLFIKTDMEVYVCREERSEKPKQENKPKITSKDLDELFADESFWEGIKQEPKQKKEIQRVTVQKLKGLMIDALDEIQ